VVTGQHPGTVFVAIPEFPNLRSFDGLNNQLAKILPYTQKLVEDSAYAQGYHFLCHSQGALLCRCLVEMFNDHNIDTLVSLAGPQHGVFSQEYLTASIPFLKHFPELVNVTLENAWKVFGQTPFQHLLSVANLWHDPTHEIEFEQQNIFLPIFNNLVNHSLSAQYKANFLKLKKAVFMIGDVSQSDPHGGEYDDAVAPWQTGVWGFWDGKGNMLAMNETRLYRDDLIGLRTMDERKDLHVQAVKGIHHMQWMENAQLIQSLVLPWLT